MCFKYVCLSVEMVTSLLLSITAQEELQSKSTAAWGDMNYVKKQTKITSFFVNSVISE